MNQDESPVTLFKPRVRAAAPGRVRLLEGPFKRRQDVHARYLRQVNPDRLLAGFREQARLDPKGERYGGWESRDIAGHSLGHYLSAVSWLYGARGDNWARERVAYLVAELEACQEANGDGYALPVPKEAFDKVRDGHIDASPFSLNGVWVPNYTLHKVLAGLRDAFRMTGSETALRVWRRFTDWLCGVMEPLDEEQVQELLRSEHGGMNEVLADLTADTGDRRYLELAARGFHHRDVLDPLLRGEDHLDGLHGNTQIPKVVGLAREYELSGERAYRFAAERFWEHVVTRRSYVTGGHGESEHFFPPEQFPEKLTPFTCETCNTYNMLKLTRHLFAWEPDAAHMDFVERATINHLLANIGRKGGEFGYFLGLESVGVKVFSKPFDGWWCCVGTGLENPVRYGEQVYSIAEDSVWVNLYVGSVLQWPEQGVTIRQETAFPDGDTVRLIVSCERSVSFALNLRHPGWCRRIELRINAKTEDLQSTPSSYMRLERTWSDGDVIEIRLPMELRFEELPHSGGKTVALMFGPSVLAGLVPPAEGVPDPARERFSDHLSARGKTDAFPPVLVGADRESLLEGFRPEVAAFGEFSSRGVVAPADLRFVPLHRVYEEHYAVYFPVMSALEWSEREAELRAEKAALASREAATIDSVTPGYQQPEVEHGVRSDKSTIRTFQGRKCREADPDGWFSYDMAVDPEADVVLVVTYWGGEWHPRRFDILVDEQVVATQSLRADKPGDFFDVGYPVSRDLTGGKEKVTVRFQAHTDHPAGGVYGLKVVRAEEHF